eukprot:14700193-Alexandrium_andersonii.AAC.1
MRRTGEARDYALQCMAKVPAAERMRLVAGWRAELTGRKQRARRADAEAEALQASALGGLELAGRRSSAKRSAREAFSQAGTGRRSLRSGACAATASSC